LLLGQANVSQPTPYNLSQVAGSAVATAASGVQKQGIVGSTGAVLDGTVAAGTAPTNALATLAQYNTTVPAPTAAQTLIPQLGPNGNLLVQVFRRSQIGVATGSIASTTAATMITAGSSGVYNDITELVLSESAETTAAVITVNVSDGTNSYKFGIDCATTGASPIVIQFSPPLPAASAATAWTIAESAADCTVQYSASYVKQTANF
jgi:hypothetical protein